jgi:hypothetical protein
MPWVVAPFTAGGQPRGSFADHLPDRAQWTTRDNALAETTIWLYETECIRDGSPLRRGPLAIVADVEDATSARVAWYNEQRLMRRLGRIPPAEAAHYATTEAPEMRALATD